MKAYLIAGFLALIFSILIFDSVYNFMQSHKNPGIFTDREYSLQPYSPNVNETNVVHGDLISPRMVKKYANYREEHLVTDNLGFFAPPGVTINNSSVVVVGDSFTQGIAPDMTLSGMITKKSNNQFKTYNMGSPGYYYNSVLAFIKYFEPLPDPKSVKNRKILILSLTKRNLTGEVVEEIRARSMYSAKKFRKKKLQRDIFSYFPHNFFKKEKRRSITVKTANNVFLSLNETLGHVTPPDNVLFGKDKTIFLKDDVDFWKQPHDKNSCLLFGDVMKFIKDEAAARGFDLWLVLVPDKSDVYAELLPAAYRPPASDPTAIHFKNIVDCALEKGVSSINLLPVMRDKAGSSADLIYYSDDTHWNEKGIEAAADAIYKKLKERSE